MTSVSVIVPAYNAAATLGDTLLALQRQVNVRPSVELIVVDNGSTDRTADIIRGFAGVIALREDKRGPAAARNCGLRRASGDIVVHLDADTLPTRAWLSNLIAPFTDPSVVLAAGRTLCFHPTTAVERYIAASGLYETERAIRRSSFPFAPSLNMAVRRSAALAVGGWAEDLMTAEDVDFSHRLLKAYPTEIAYASDAVLFHRVRSTPQALVILAQTYGQGAGRICLRYDAEASWNTLTTAKVVIWLAIRAVTSAIFGARRALLLASREQQEFYRYHFLWLRSFYQGFFSVYYGAKQRATLAR